jgi:hypothetical protein
MYIFYFPHFLIVTLIIIIITIIMLLFPCVCILFLCVFVVFFTRVHFLIGLWVVKFASK